MRRFEVEEYQRLVQESFPNLSVVRDYKHLNENVVMACSRCGGEFRRLAVSNRKSDCPICFAVYLRVNRVPTGFAEAIAGLDDIRDLGKGNLDYHLSAEDVSKETLGKRYEAMGFWGRMLHSHKRDEGSNIDDIIEAAIAEQRKRL